MSAVASHKQPIAKEQFPSWKYFRVWGENGKVSESHQERTYSFFWARNALYYSLVGLGISSGAHVLLPAYLCRAAVEPFEHYGAQIEFYGIDRNGEPDFAEIAEKINPRTRAVLTAHYFGFPQKIEELRALCDRHHLALIEDCAHVLRGTVNGKALGRIGDASVFSWRKFLPIYDGGELWFKASATPLKVPWTEERFLFTLKVGKSLSDQFFENSRNPLAKGFFNGFESFKNAVKNLRKTGGEKPLFALDSSSATFDDSLLNQKMSLLSTWVRAHSDIPAIIARRRQNYLRLQEGVRAIGGVTLLHPELPDDVCPWVLPLFLDGVAEPHLALQKEGIPAVNWAGVRSPLVRAGQFPDADFLYDNLVFLPVHQNLREEDLQSTVDAVMKICERRAA